MASERGWARKMASITAVVPVFNAERTLERLCVELEEHLAKLAETFEIILVEDGSRDRSWKIIEELARASGSILGIRLSRNFGQHNALLCGIRAASGEVIVTIDDDLQNPPAEIKKLLVERRG